MKQVIFQLYHLNPFFLLVSSMYRGQFDENFNWFLVFLKNNGRGPILTHPEYCVATDLSMLPIHAPCDGAHDVWRIMCGRVPVVHCGTTTKGWVRKYMITRLPLRLIIRCYINQHRLSFLNY